MKIYSINDCLIEVFYVRNFICVKNISIILFFY